MGNEKRRFYTTEDLVHVLLRWKKEKAIISEIAKELSTGIESVRTIQRTFKNRYFDNAYLGKRKNYTNYVNALEKAKTLMDASLLLNPPKRKIESSMPRKNLSQKKENIQKDLTIEEIIKIIYLRKKQNKTFDSIALQLNKNPVTVWACMNSIEKNYWSTNPLLISYFHVPYFYAMLAAQEILIKDIDPFTDDITEIINHAKQKVDKILEERKQTSREKRDEINEETAHTHIQIEKSSPPEPIDTPEIEKEEDKDGDIDIDKDQEDNLFTQFEKDIVSIITTFVTKLVKQKEESILASRQTVADAYEKLEKENEELKKRNNDLTRKLLQQKQSSLASSLKSSFGTI